ncbi:MAG: TraB/GumN family protein, partial [Henriciella sp.]|uniref:TraB/GumN family protein n=1 Tax=Henriciella sp. TaxID=1968823 RepID=UPI003C7626AB
TSGGDGVYEAIFLDRNKTWVPQIEAMLDEPGTVFVAVGAGHLAGPDSVITMLRDEGYDVEGP